MKLTKDELEMLIGTLNNANAPVKVARQWADLYDKLNEMHKEVDNEKVD